MRIPVFQSTRPRGARLSTIACISSIHRFNPRARAGRDNDQRGAFHVADVSIHAPARGATHHRGELFEIQLVSIHAPARGATTLYGTHSTVDTVSIHAPARGATKSEEE